MPENESLGFLDELRAFLQRRQVKRKVHCPPGSMFCMKCRAARRPPPGLVEIAVATPITVNLSGICPDCEGLMYRRANRSRLTEIGFGDLPSHAWPDAPNR
jgi:hypothetical protein